MNDGHATYKLCRRILFLPVVAEDTYTGESDVDGRPHGNGTMLWASGDLYEGQWNDGLKHGHGLFRFATGDVYTGEYARNEMHGQGTLRYANGDSYVGEWKHSVMQGHGAYIYANGEQFEGSFKKGIADGPGTYKYGASCLFEVGVYRGINPVGESVRVSPFDTWRMFNGEAMENIARTAAMVKIETILRQ